MRFPQVVLDGDKIIARGRVTAISNQGEERLASCDIWLDRDGSDPPLEGTAVVALPD
ncbi:MAG: hypothetical protein P8Y69_10920 [Gammaproteobacteria bacterium]